MHLTLHSDGLQFLRGLGFAALFLLFVALRFSPWLGEQFVTLLTVILNGVPQPSKPKVSRRIQKQSQHKKVIAFDFLAALTVGYLAADWLFIPEPYRLADERRWPIVLSVFLASTLLIFIGSQVWNERVAWKKGAFWISMVATMSGELCLVRIWQPKGPSGIMLLLIAGGLFFLWLFGLLIRTEQSEASLRRINLESSPEISRGTIPRPRFQKK